MGELASRRDFINFVSTPLRGSAWIVNFETVNFETVVPTNQWMMGPAAGEAGR